MGRSTAPWLILAMALCACGDDESGGATSGGDDGCGDGEVAVSYLGGSNEHRECKPVPAACGQSASCAGDDCIAALYDLCESPYFGVGCSDSGSEVIVSCNP